MSPKPSGNLAQRGSTRFQCLWIAFVNISLVLALGSATFGDDWAGAPAPRAEIPAAELAESIDFNSLMIVNRDISEAGNSSQDLREAIEQPPSDELFGADQWRTTDKPLFRIRGRIDSDVISANQSVANKASFGDLPDTVGLRRARIGGQGHFTSDSRYVAEIDLATGSLAIRDLLVGWGDIRDNGEIRIGHLREPFSLEGGTSANAYAFLERSPINSFDPARNWGGGYYRCAPDEDSTIAMGLFHSGKGPNDLRGGEASDTALTARWTALPWYEEGGLQLMHVGLALSSRFPDQGIVVINQSPSSPLLDLGDSSASPFVPTIRIASKFRQLFNAQWAFMDGPFSAQAEWYGNYIDQTGGQPIFYHGTYLNLNCFLTGEHRAYQTQNGVFGSVTVDQPFLRGFSSHKEPRTQGYGAWELTGQVSYADTSDPHTPLGPQGRFVGVRLPQVTIGVNWYLADRLRLMFNYTHSIPDEPNTGSSSANLFSSRLAMFW